MGSVLPVPALPLNRVCSVTEPLEKALGLSSERRPLTLAQE
jgi:hypothetical protein